MSRKLKRGLDLSISFVALILLVPIWCLVSFFIFLEDRGPVFYRQERLGKNKQLFTLLKFRSMRVNNIPPMELGAVKNNHPLVTTIGYFIRRFKIDETPQFLNVISGEMSLVGPRPCLPGRLKQMTALEKKRFNIQPGLSGWAEVNGNVELTWEEQVVLDLWYIEHWSNWLDCRIILKSFLVLVFGSHRNEMALLSAKNLYKDT